ncbi:hypothetical protein GCM10009785_01300 [Brooklawnia cerclae]|uniref:Uncharacterized protein n=1 Tax=Brooklawnia cerclae TaxID=349934 RepID=A0ABX0SD09_9ACTN|nr:hypothetical protein [Brooklawnia cerclae]NIH56277.1 hypothetical protein [Brooklawnia cerclae]
MRIPIAASVIAVAAALLGLDGLTYAAVATLTLTVTGHLLATDPRTQGDPQ